MSNSSRRYPAAIAAAAALALTLAGCTGPTVPMQPASNADAPECAEIIVRLPDTLDGLDKRLTNAQATGAWGTPATVLLHCGLATPPPTSDDCISLNGVDWIADESSAPIYTFTTYGRSPAVQVTVDATDGTVSGTSVLLELGALMEYLPVVGGCVGVEDLLDPESTPTA